MAAKCNDPKCAIHGQIKVRGNVFTGAVVSDKADKTIIVERVLSKRVPKYERYRKVRSRITAHNPNCIKAKEGNIVKIGETRKISKTKSFVVLEVAGEEKVRVREEPFLEQEAVKEAKEAAKPVKEAPVEKTEVKEKSEEKK
jgi:small subunit ribosomal protein S17